MSTTNSYSSSTNFSASYSSTSNGRTTGSAHSQTTTSNDDGTTVKTTSQNLGDRPMQTMRRFDNEGREVEGTGMRRVEDVSGGKTQEELDAEKRYEEAIEEEYAKREGGA